MFTRLVRTSVPGNFILLAIVFITGWWSLFIGHFPVFTDSRSIIFQLFPGLTSSVILTNVISLVFIILTAILMVPFSSKYLHNSSGNSFPSFLFITFISSYYWVFSSFPAMISIFFCMLALRSIFEIYHQVRVFHFGFMAGFYSAIASLIYSPAISFIFVSWMGFILIRTFKLREFIIIAVGFITPLLLTHAIFMVAGEENLLNNLALTVFSKNPIVFQNSKQIALTVIIGVLIIWNILKIISSGSLKKVVLRRYFQTFVSAIVFFILTFFGGFNDFGLLAMILLPLSFVMAISITSIRKQSWISFILFLVIALQVISQLQFRF